VARRARASRSSHRPGGQGPDRSRKTGETSSAALPAAPEPATDADIDAAIDIIGSQYPEASVAQVAPAVEPKRTRRARQRAKSRPDDLAARAVAEDAWVRADLRRIALVSVVLLAGLAVAWVAFVLLDVLSLY
jgi:hypothetical protein